MKDLNENKKSNKVLIVIIVILLIVSLGAIGYICYDKFIKEDPKQIESKEVIKNEIKDVDNDIKIAGTRTEDKDGNVGYVCHLIAKVNNKWQELDSDGEIIYFGMKNNKIYYSNSTEFKYIDLSNDNLSPITWIKLEEKDYASGHFIGYIYPSSGIIKDDAIYFVMNSGADKIRKLKLGSTSYSKIEKVGTELDDFNFLLDDNNILYYDEFIPSSANSNFVSYNLNTKEKKVLKANKYMDVNFYKDKALIYDNDSEKLYLYDLKTSQEKYIGYVPEHEESSTIFKDEVYYSKGEGDITKYENGKNTTIYEYIPDTDEDEYAMRGFIVYNENLFEYSLGSSENDFFVSNGKRISKQEAQNMMEKYDVHMKDNTTKTFYEYDIVSDFAY